MPIIKRLRTPPRIHKYIPSYTHNYITEKTGWWCAKAIDKLKPCNR